MSLGYRGSSNADYYLNIMHSDRLTDGRNVLSFSNPDIDKAIDDAKIITDEADRIAAFQKCQQIAHDEIVCVPLYSNTIFNISQKNLAGVQLLPTSGSDFTGLYWVE